MGLTARAAHLVGTPVSAAVPLQHHPPAAVMAASAAEIVALIGLIVTGNPAAMVVLVVLSALLIAVMTTNTRRVLVLTGQGNVMLAASVSGWPERVVGPAPRSLAIPEPGGLGVSLEIAGGRWWVDRASFRFLRRARLMQADREGVA